MKSYGEERAYDDRRRVGESMQKRSFGRRAEACMLDAAEQSAIMIGNGKTHDVGQKNRSAPEQITQLFKIITHICCIRNIENYNTFFRYTMSVSNMPHS